MPQITFRVDDVLFEKIEEARKEQDRSIFVREVITAHFDADSRQSANASQTELHLNDEVAFLRGKLDEMTALHGKSIASQETANALHAKEKQELMKLISQEQSLNMKQLSDPTKTKNWWEFWK